MAVELLAPQEFALDTNRHEPLVAFLRQLVSLTLGQNLTVALNFRDTKKLYSDGTLLFLAELNRILQRRPASVKCIRIPPDTVVREVFSHLGIFALLSCPRTFASNRADVVHWQLFSGIQADFTQGAGEAIDKLPCLSRDHVKVLYRSASEALTNVTQHAYTKPRMDGTGVSDDRGWWMFVREEPETLTVLFCDLGLGVPHTVPNSGKHDSWLEKALAGAKRAIGLHTHRDGELISVTVEEKRSRFRKDHRGNGFANMVETINAVEGGILRVYSNRGLYYYQKHNGDTRQAAQNFSNSIYGTVVGWQITLPKEAA